MNKTDKLPGKLRRLLLPIAAVFSVVLLLALVFPNPVTPPEPSPSPTPAPTATPAPTPAHGGAYPRTRGGAPEHLLPL